MAELAFFISHYSEFDYKSMYADTIKTRIYFQNDLDLI